MFSARLSMMAVGVTALALLGFGCNDDDDDSPGGGSGGEAGEASGGQGGESGAEAGQGGQGGEDAEAGTVTITVTDIDAAYEDKPVYVTLFPGEIDCLSVTEPGELFGAGVVADGGCEIVIPSVEADEYSVCAMIDDDGDMQPTPGDVGGQSQLTVSGDTEGTMSTTDWITLE